MSRFLRERSDLEQFLQRADTTADERQRLAEPIFLDEHKARDESLVEVATHATARESIDRSDERTLAAPVEAPLQPRPDADAAGFGNIPIEDQWDELLAHAPVTPPMLALEHYEALKANLWPDYSESAMKVVLFVGACAGSGTSTAAANFAATLAQELDSQVLLIDANVRSRNGSDLMRADLKEVDPRLGQARISVASPSHESSVWGPSNLHLLSVCSKCSMPFALFESKAFDEFLRAARARFKYVVVDAPPLQGNPGSLVLSRKADGVVLVIESEKTRKRSALWAKQQIEGAGGKLLGVVLNRRRRYIPDWLYKRI